jgi:signal transduction histidine kinase
VLGSLREEIAVVDRDGTILEVNESWRAAGRAAPGTNCVEYWQQEVGTVGDGAAQMSSEIEAVLTGERERFHVELPALSPPATWYELSARTLQRPEGGAVVTRSDITARKQAELDSREQLGELSGAMAHELSQPLTAILSNAQAAQRLLTRDEPDLREISSILSDIADDDRRAGEVIQRVRAMLRKDEPQFVPLDLNWLIREVLLLERSDLIARQVAVAVELSPDLPRVYGDRVQLQQVVLNLVLNACEAMSTTAVGERRLVLVTARDQEGCQLDVVDQGCGIPADALERVFEPFFTTRRQGLGLGLSICRSIVEAHGGRLWASNNEESGATFHLALPANGERTT